MKFNWSIYDSINKIKMSKFHIYNMLYDILKRTIYLNIDYLSIILDHKSQI